MENEYDNWSEENLKCMIQLNTESQQNAKEVLKKGTLPPYEALMTKVIIQDYQTKLKEMKKALRKKK